MTDRLSIDRYLMNIAHIVSGRSTCHSKHPTGAVAAVDGRIVMTGYNGTPSGVPHCNASGCVRLGDNKHAYLLHAEENIVAQAVRFGISLARSTVYVTHMPCSHCAAVLSQAGVMRVVYDRCSLSTAEAMRTVEVLKYTGVTLVSIDAEVL